MNNPNKRIPSFLFLIFSFFLILLTALTTSLGPNVLLEASVSKYVGDNINDNNRFLHTRISRKNDESLEEYNNQTNLFLANHLSDLKNHSSYILFEQENDNKFSLMNDDFSLAMATKIMRLNYRNDKNRKFLESIRLQQYRNDIESKVVANNYDFSFFISSIMADRIIENSNGLITNYDQILDINGIGLTYSIEINDEEKIGHIRNIYYIDDTNRISQSLYYYLNDFIIIYGQYNQLFNGYDQVIYYDFLSTNKSIESNLLMLNDVTFGQIEFYDNSTNESSVQLGSLFDIVNLSMKPTIEFILLIVTVLIMWIMLLFGFRVRNVVFSKKGLVYFISMIGFLFGFHLLIKIISLTSFNYYAYLVSNYIFGTFTIMICFLFGVYLITFKEKLRKFKHENE